MVKNIRRCFALIILLMILMILMFGGKCGVIYAEDNKNKFDETKVIDDLRSSTVDGKPFDLNRYPFDSTGLVKSPAIVNFVEYCYSFKVNMQSNYGLYLYFYNPQALEIDTRSRGNKVQLAVKYDADGAPTDYEKFDLKFCSVSTEQNYYRLFYKFKIVDRKGADGKTILQRVNSNERRYDISGVELVAKGSPNAIDYPVGGTYKFTGYVAGYGPDAGADSNLQCRVSELETIRLDVHNTNYRTASSSAGKDHQNQLDSVYFSVDNEILEKYGKLQKVKAEWYEYKTAPIIAISDKGVYDVLNGYVGNNIGEHTEGLRYSLGYDRNVISSSGSTIVNYGWSYNVRCYSNVGLSTMIVESRDKCPLLPYLFYSGGANIKDYSIPSEAIKEWIYGYKKSAVKGYLPIKNGQISADLFGVNVDDGRTRGYNCVEIDASEQYDLLSYTANHWFWDKVCDYGFFAALFGKVPTDENVFGIEPIYAVKDSDVSYDKGGIAKALLIDESDADAFKDYYYSAKKADKTTFLFRYAVTDYFSGNLDIDDRQSTTGLLIKNSAYMARETVFLDFDIIQLTFNRDGVYHVIPVVSNPIDAVGAITPPVDFEGTEWWKIVLGVILLILLLILIFPILKYLIKGIVWLIFLPFRGIGALMRGHRPKEPMYQEKTHKKKKPEKAPSEFDFYDDDFLDDMELWEDME